MARGDHTPNRGRGTPRGGRGRGSGGTTPRGGGSGMDSPRGRGRGGGAGGGYGARFEVEQEAAVVMAQLGIAYPSPRGTPYRGRGGGGFVRGYSGGYDTGGGRGGGGGAQTPPYPFMRGRGQLGYGYVPPSGRGGPGGPGGRGRARGGGLGYRQMPDDEPPAGAGWGRGAPAAVGRAGAAGRARPLLRPVKFVKAGTLFQDEEEIFAPEALDTQEDQEETAKWLEKAFERAAEIGRAADAGAGHEGGGGSGADTPRDALEELVAQAVQPGIFFQAQANAKLSVTVVADGTLPELQLQLPSPPPVPADQDVETDEEEEQIVFVAPMAGLRSHAASKAPSPEPQVRVVPVSAAPMLAIPIADPAVQSAVASSMAVDAPPAPVSALTHPPLPAVDLAADTAAPAEQWIPLSVDPSRAATPAVFPSAKALTSLLSAFKASAMNHSRAETTSAASTPAGVATPAEPAPAPAADADMDVVMASAPADVQDAVHPRPAPADEPDAVGPAESGMSVLPAFPTAPHLSTLRISPALNAAPRKAYTGKGKARGKAVKHEIKRQRRIARRRRAMMSLRGGEETGGGGVPRVGDSDLEWGSDGPPEVGEGMDEDSGSGSGSEEEEEDKVFTAAADALVAGRLSDALGAMDMDELDEDAVARFALGLGAQQVSIADLEIEERVKREEGDRSSGEQDSDEDEEAGSDSEDVERILRLEEKGLVGESDEDSESDSEEEESEEEAEGGEPVAGPSGGMKARMARTKAGGAVSAKIKKKGKGKWRMNYDEDDSDDDAHALFEGNFAWDSKAQEDEGFLGEIQDVLDENADILQGRDRKEKKKLFNAIRDGKFGQMVDDDELFASSMLKSKRRKRNDLPPELQIQWDKDRAKKADYKRARALARKREEGNPFKAAGKAKKSGKKKGKSNPDESDTSESDSEVEGPFEPIADMLSLERMIRVFLASPGKTTMTLPAMDKESRRRVHLLAECFKLKSQSKGKGTDRFPILTKSVRSGTSIDENKVERIVLASTEAGPGSNMAMFNRAFYKKRGDGGAGAKGGAKGGAGQHAEGEIVGAKAAKIESSNMGYKLLQMMGWSEGDRIGKTGGIIDPLTARIKRTKLGLGAAI